MKKNLILYGPIRCGKSTMIQEALGTGVLRAGGYVTLRSFYKNCLIGFDLAPAPVLFSRQDLHRTETFLEFGEPVVRHPEVFSGFGTELLKEAMTQDFAVIDEFGGMELLITPFRQELHKLLKSSVPCIGVFKTPQASQTLTAHLNMDYAYTAAYEEMLRFLQNDPNTQILSTSGWKDMNARKEINDWAGQYVRK